MIKNKDFVREKLERGCCSRYVSDWWAASTWNPIFVHGLSHRQFESWMDEHYCFISHTDWGLTNKWSGLPFSRWYFYIQQILWRWPYVWSDKAENFPQNLPQIINYLQIVVSGLNEWMNVHVALNDFTCRSLPLVFLGYVAGPSLSIQPTMTPKNN
jgi:hypothetical protein